jgi:hypothetical protein
MAKEAKSGPELVDMIQRELNIGGVHLGVGHRDGTWTAEVLAHPSIAHDVPKRVAQIVARLRSQYDLQT